MLISYHINRFRNCDDKHLSKYSCRNRLGALIIQARTHGEFACL
jgi:hypothetical protein